MLWTKPESTEVRRKTATMAWVLLILASMILIGIGLARTMFFIWAPEPTMLEKARIGGLYISAGCVLSLAAGGWGLVTCQGQPRLGERLRWATRDPRGLGGSGGPVQPAASPGRCRGIPFRAGRGRRGHQGTRPPAALPGSTMDPLNGLTCKAAIVDDLTGYTVEDTYTASSPCAGPLTNDAATTFLPAPARRLSRLATGSSAGPMWASKKVVSFSARSLSGVGTPRSSNASSWPSSFPTSPERRVRT